MVDLSSVTVEWGALTLHGRRDDGDLSLASLTGWEELPPIRTDGRPRPNAHGLFPGRVLATARQVVVSGFCATPARRDEFLTMLQSSLSLPGNPSTEADLSVTAAGRTLTASAQLVGFAPTLDGLWGAGLFGWSARWLCADPFRYAAQVTGSTALPVQAGGLEYDLYTDGAGVGVGWLVFGDAGTSGKVSLANAGTAESRPVFTVSGTLPDGFELTETYTGNRLTYEGPLTAAGDAVTLDSSTGRVRLGSADRGGLLTRGEWWGVPAGGDREVLFSTLGPYSADALLSVSYRPTYW